MISTLLNNLEQKVRTMVTEQATLRLEISQLTQAIARLERHLLKHHLPEQHLDDRQTSLSDSDSHTVPHSAVIAPAIDQ